MDNKRSAMVSAISEVFTKQMMHPSIESYTEANFRKYYQKAIKNGLPWSLEDFYSKIPDSYRNTRPERLEQLMNDNPELVRTLERNGCPLYIDDIYYDPNEDNVEKEETCNSVDGAVANTE